jgi:hypothetical protein
MTEQISPTLQIKRDLDNKLEQIRSDRDLSAEAKSRYIAEAYEDASRRYTEAIESAERAATEKVSKAEREVMQIRYPLAASDAEKASVRASYRGAYDMAYYSATLEENQELVERELVRLLERAERSGDPELADAVFHVALERGVESVTESYLATRPEQRRRVEALQAANEEAASVEQELSGAKMYPLRRPPELNTRAPAEDGSPGLQASAYAGGEPA